MAPVDHRYKWLYVYGFVRPTTGEVFWLILPTLNKELFSAALSEFAQWVGAGKNKRVVLTIDQAGWHTSKEVQWPEGLHLLMLPSRSPELMPAERLWPLVDETVANRRLEDLGELEEVLVERCRGALGKARDRPLAYLFPLVEGSGDLAEAIRRIRYYSPSLSSRASVSS